MGNGRVFAAWREFQLEAAGFRRDKIAV